MGKKGNDPINVAVGGRIRHFRENIAKETRETFVSKTTLSLQFVYDIESGNKGLSAKSILKIVEAYRNSHGLTADYLILGDMDNAQEILSPINYKQLELHLGNALNILKNNKNEDK